MDNPAQSLIDIAKSLAPDEGFWGYYDLVDALNANPVALARFKEILRSSSAPDLDEIDSLDKKYGWIVMGAADAMDLLPDDPRLFLSESAAASLPAEKVLGALASACIVNDVATVGRLAGRVDVNALDHNKQTMLTYAVGNNHAACVRILLDHGANPNRVQNWGNTAMHICANSCSSKEIFRMLIEAGGDINIPNGKGESALELLRTNGRVEWFGVV